MCMCGCVCVCVFVFPWYLSLSLVMVIVARFLCWHLHGHGVGPHVLFMPPTWKLLSIYVLSNFLISDVGEPHPPCAMRTSLYIYIYVGLRVKSELTYEAPKCNLVTLCIVNVLSTNVVRVSIFFINVPIGVRTPIERELGIQYLGAHHKRNPTRNHWRANSK